MKFLGVMTNRFSTLLFVLVMFIIWTYNYFSAYNDREGGSNLTANWDKKELIRMVKNTIITLLKRTYFPSI